VRSAELCSVFPFQVLSKKRFDFAQSGCRVFASETCYYLRMGKIPALFVGEESGYVYFALGAYEGLQ
jgi:hypothetical protein